MYIMYILVVGGLCVAQVSPSVSHHCLVHPYMVIILWSTHTWSSSCGPPIHGHHPVVHPYMVITLWSTHTWSSPCGPPIHGHHPVVHPYMVITSYIPSPQYYMYFITLCLRGSTGSGDTLDWFWGHTGLVLGTH